jgi:hypothetical protein
MDYGALRSELTTDPVTLGYSGLTDTQAAAKLNATDTGRTQARTAVPVAEIYNNIVNADWPTAASTSESKLRALLGMQTIDASNANTKTIIGAIFGAGTQTRTNLLAIGTQTVSRATELGLGPVLVSDVTKARAGVW